MASIFKIMRLDHALSEQEEIDKKSLYLMGLTNSNQGAAIDKILDDLQSNSTLMNKVSTDKNRVHSLGGDLRTVTTPEPVEVNPVFSQNKTGFQQ